MNLAAFNAKRVQIRATYRTTLVVLSLFICHGLSSQQLETASSSQHTQAKPPKAIEGVSGVEPTSHIRYARLVLSGSLQASAEATVGPLSSSPMLVAQCSLRPDGKYVFELFATFGGATDLAFYPPWRPSSSSEIFPPRTEKMTLTMEFLGYTHVKPLKRQWEVPVQTPGQYRFNPPGLGSSNLEEIAYDLRYLLSLPTLRLTLGRRSADFETLPWIDAIRKEPLCVAAGL